MLVSISPGFLTNKLTLTNLALPTIQRLMTRFPNLYQFPWHVIQLDYTCILMHTCMYRLIFYMKGRNADMKIKTMNDKIVAAVDLPIDIL